MVQRCDSGDGLEDLCPEAHQPSGTGEKVTEVGREALLIVRLATTLLGYLGIGQKWMVALCQLLAFATLLMPGFLQMGVFYFFSPRVHRSLRYGSKPRNTLDVYVPRLKWLTMEGPRPVVIYITGGAWTIGYKAWGALVGRRLSQRGILVFCLDYRNFPQGNAEDMLEDVNTGIAWVLHICQYFGGDMERVHIVSQSAGAQLAGLAIMKQAMRCARQSVGSGGHPSWDPTEIKGFVGMSGAYDLQELHLHLHRRGMYESLLRAIFTVGGRVSYAKLSPTHVARELSKEAWQALPPILLLHGTADRTIPPQIAEGFLEAIQKSGGTASLKLFEGKTHTSPIVEDPLRGKDLLVDEIISMIYGKEMHLSAFPMVPGFLADLAAAVSPF
mmetsp:Transcript_18243/g.51089  ORF Transcript_18243/g.51089 Transcript_18243/m.51089 type:complete len:386 (+) Transcript_18243:2-1159(+)